MAEYWGTTKPVIVDTWENMFGEKVIKVKCPDTKHRDFKYYINARAVTGPDKATRLLYKCIPGERNPDGSFEEARFIEIATGEEWNAERDIRIIRSR